MSFDLKSFSDKINRLKGQLEIESDEISASTGINIDRLCLLEQGKVEPTGDEVLILADYFNCDFKYFISNDKEAPIEQTEILFRRYGNDFLKDDRRAIQEVLYMAECEHYLMDELGKLRSRQEFNFVPFGEYYKGHAEEGARELRKFLGYSENEINRNVFEDLRQAGFHIFRRVLNNSKISGVSVRHPIAGRCILVNYNEDVYRQRFTVVHEAAHGIFDLNNHDGVFVSFENHNGKDKYYIEIRANHFASRFLMPRGFLNIIPNRMEWNGNKILKWANDIKVNPEAFSIALKDAGLINESQYRTFKSLKIPREQKVDAELPMSMSEKARLKKLSLLQKGISDYYVRLCFDAYMQDIVSLSRIAEMLLVCEAELHEIRELYEVSL
jgi:Zn-dependent peptidase ImmA (M78 family)/transcriptional regulator with XRE-family HTH domain